jgi:hypothetical protein
MVEGSGSVKGNTTEETRSGLSAGPSVPSDLSRVRRVAATDKEVRFTALLHHVDVDRLRAAYGAVKPKAAPGVDGVTWADYGLDLEENLRDLHARVHRVRTGQDRRGGCTSRNPMGGCGSQVGCSGVTRRARRVWGGAPQAWVRLITSRSKAWLASGVALRRTPSPKGRGGAVAVLGGKTFDRLGVDGRIGRFGENECH